MNDEVKFNQKVRTIVDPMIMRLRSDLFGTTYNSTLVGSLIPKSVIVEGVETGLNQAVNDGGLVRSYTVYTAGPAGIQAGKVVYFDGTKVHHADSTNLAHAGKVVGIAMTAAGPNSPVNIQTYGTLEIDDVYSFTGQGTLFVGTDGSLVATPPAGVKFIQVAGTSLTAHKILIDLEVNIIMV